MIRLYALPLSAYCTKVRIVLRIKGIPYEESPPPGGHYSSAEYQALMPPGTIPSIKHDGFRLFDSEAIVEYLEDTYPVPPLRAEDPRDRARQRAISQFHNTRVEPAIRVLFPLVRQGLDTPGEDLPGDLLDGFFRQLEKLERIIDPAPYIGGAKPCLADCAFPATLRMGQDILAHLGADVSFSPRLDAWLGTLEGHAVIGEEVAANRAAVGNWLEGFRRSG